MPLPCRPSVAVSSSVLLLLAGCSSDASFPTGTFTTTIVAGDDPPSAQLVDGHRLDLRPGGDYVLEGAGCTAHEPGTVGRYEWRTDEGGRLTLTALEQDPCDRPLGGRRFVLTRHPWSP